MPTYAPNCRYGVAAWGESQLQWLPKLGIGWYLDFGAHMSNGPDDIEFIQVVRVKQNKSGCTYLPGYSVSPPLTEGDLGALVRAYPGALWLVGNEPDRGPNPDSDCTNRIQDDTHPEVYAEAYHAVYHFIKQRDPTAQVGIAGLVQVTPGRLQYLDKVWDTYLQKFGVPIPVDVWNMHLYILPEVNWTGQPNGIANVALGTNPALGMRESGGRKDLCGDPRDNIYCFAEHDNMPIFADQILQMRAWMKAHGQQNKPLIISEYSILYPFEDYDDPIHPTRCFLQDEFGGCFTPARVSNFMTRTFHYLESAADPVLGYPPDNYRLVQQWLWFSMYFEGAGSASNLLNRDMTSLTQVGQIFANFVGSTATYVNLLPGEVANPVIFAPTGTTGVTLSATIYNNGNAYARNPITVTFYADASLTQIIGTSVFTGTLEGCARRGITLEVYWDNLSTGAHPYWVKVEGDEYKEDNIKAGLVLVNPKQVFLPLTLRQK
ncbi:MAG: hypothetical protein H5T61_10240 [Thermoflexales bacterium]|nr:hypothetical protein [Thermoflexales bacterium]